MSRRSRAILFAVGAGACAALSASLAAAYRDGVGEQLGELRPVVVAVEPLPAGRRVGARLADRALAGRELPERFVSADALADPAEALGRVAAAGIPPGSYLVDSQFRVARRSGRGRSLPSRLRPVEISISGAGAVQPVGRGRVDVVVAEERRAAGGGSVRVLARGVRLLALSEPEPSDAGGPALRATATLAVSRAQALELIEADNYAREVRLIPHGGHRSEGGGD